MSLKSMLGGEGKKFALDDGQRWEMPSFTSEDPESRLNNVLESEIKRDKDTRSSSKIFEAKKPEICTSDDLMSKMASRLRQTESVCQEQKRKIHELEQSVAELAAENKKFRDVVTHNNVTDLLETVANERDVLRRKVAEMEAFLGEYGLAWVGGEPGNELDDSADDDVEVGPSVVEKIRRAVAKLNEELSQDPARVERRAGRAVFGFVHAADKQAIDLLVYENGLRLWDCPFAAWGSGVAAAIVRDLVDGYYPARLKEAFKDGVRINLVDRTSEPYGEGHMAEAQDAFLGRLPKRVVTASGQVVPVRESIAERIGRGAASPQVDLLSNVYEWNCGGSSELCMVQLRLPGGARRVVVRLPAGSTIAELKAAASAAAPTVLGEPVDFGRFRVTGSFPRRPLGDGEILAEAGLAPNGAVFCAEAP